MHHLVNFVLYVTVFQLIGLGVEADLPGNVKRVVGQHCLVVWPDGSWSALGGDDLFFHGTKYRILLQSGEIIFATWRRLNLFNCRECVYFVLMQTVVLATASQREEWGKEAPGKVVWIETKEDFLHFPDADVFVDLLFENKTERKELLAKLLPKLVIINSVTHTLSEINPAFVRINGWPSFLSSGLVEVTCLEENNKLKADAVFALLHKKPEWLPDTPGFVRARVVSMIINEAYLALSEGVSTKAEINTAMKLGTAYPFGPFEWGEKIGLKNIVTLLQKLSLQQARFTPAALLVEEAAKQ